MKELFDLMARNFPTEYARAKADAAGRELYAELDADGAFVRFGFAEVVPPK